MKKTVFKISLIIIIASVISGFAANGSKDKKEKSTYVHDKEIRKLISKMTLEEKIGQLNMASGDWSITGPVVKTNFKEDIKAGRIGSMLNAYTASHARELMHLSVDSTRLGIPLLLAYDVIHGHRTIFPIPLGESCSWDLALMERTARAAAEEASAEGIHWTFAPMVDISRDPRWGRVMEGAGEDTWLGKQIAKVRVKGFQGDDLSKENTILACVKHVAAYGAPQAGRDYNTVDMSERTLHEVYLPPYKAAVDAGVETAMTAFNEINGVPCTSNKWLWEDLMRKEWGFQGAVVTDYTAINELIKHGVADDLYHAAVLSLNAGIDIDMVGQGFVKYLKKAVENGDVTEERIDESVYRVLKAKFDLGLFDNPYRYCDVKREKEVVMSPEKVALAREAAQKNCVLLKNNDILPISKDVKTIAVIGPLADNKEDMIGGWSAAGDRKTRPVTLLEGIKNIVGENTKVLYALGTEIESQSTDGFTEAIKIAKEADVVILALGESNSMSAEAQSRTNLDLPGNQNALADSIIKSNDNTAVILMNGRPLTIQHLNDVAPAILETWFAGTEAGNGIADVIFGDYNPSGKIVMTFPRNVGQIPIFYNHKNTGRPYNPDDHFTSKYIDSPNTPLYPFGYGLSYTTFEYSPVTIDNKEITSDEELTASVTVTNTGDFDGEEIVQLYIRDLVGSVTRPVKELKGFQKILLKKGESKTVTFKIGKDELSFYRADMSYGTEPGEFYVFIGPDSSTDNKAEFTLK
jgi:beta-glucosidase